MMRLFMRHLRAVINLTALSLTALSLAVLSLAVLTSPAHAQLFSDGYKFLEAVKKREGETVTQALNEPGSVIVNTRDKTTGETGLHIVTKRRDLQWIRFLVSRGGNPNIADKKGVTPLAIAANLGFKDGAEALIKGGARIDVSNDAGETPLIGAVHRRDVPMVRLLLENGANPDRSDNSGRTARDYAALIKANSALMDAFVKHDERVAAHGTEPKTYGPSL